MGAEHMHRPQASRRQDEARSEQSTLQTKSSIACVKGVGELGGGGSTGGRSLQYAPGRETVQRELEAMPMRVLSQSLSLLHVDLTHCQEERCHRSRN